MTTNRDNPEYAEPLLPLRDEIVASLPEYGDQVEFPLDHYLNLLRRVVRALDMVGDKLPADIAGV